MLRTKKDVDKHVRLMISNLREDEKNLRGYRIGGLYFNIGEYNSAVEYLQRYIRANDKNPAAYKLLGQCYEKLKQPDKQLFAYQRAFELDKKQTDLLVDICKLLQSNKVPDITPAKAQYWYDLAESRNNSKDSVTTSSKLFSSTDKNHPRKSLINDDNKRLQNETRKHETTHNMSDSFVSANGRSDLEESGTYRYERETEMVTPVPPTGYDNIERLMRQMMESLNILKDDVAEVRNRLQNIEEQLHKDSLEDAGILDDYYLDQELQNQNQNRNLNNTSMLANVSRNQTFSQQTPKSSQMPKNAHQLNARSTPKSTAFSHQMGMNNSFNNMNPLMGNMYGSMQMNPTAYQAALLNQAGYNQSTQFAAAANFQIPTPSIIPYGNDVYAMQALYAQQLLNDPRNSANLMGLLQQQQQQQPPLPQVAAAVQQPAVQPPYAMTNPSANPLASSITSVPPSVQPITVISQTAFNQSTAPLTQTQPQKQWNASFKNTPVEKAPPVNVVITSSDPVPQNLSSITTHATPNFSVTIPPHHIKNNPATSALGAALANPTITAALQDKKPIQSPILNAKTTTSTVTVPTSQEQKSIFGNLSKTSSSTPFSSPSTILTTDAKKSETPTSEAAKPSPFAAFSFGMQSASTSSIVNQSKPLFSFNSNIGQLNKTTETSALANAATPETPSQSQNEANASSNSAKDDDDNYEPTAHFEPVIPLPDLVEVKTGEENETILFEHRAKLLRFVKESKEWKERGIGNMKVMVNNDDPNKVRLLMRREQVLKLCCNQMLAKDTKFNKMSNVALTWFGQDYSENELQVEMLAIRFKTAELCKQFHDAILSAQAKMTDPKSHPAKTGSASDSSSSSAIEKSTNKVDKQGFGDKFKPKAGSWSCKACYTSNTAETLYCACCEEPKDDTVPKKEKSSIFGSTNAAAPKFSFGNLTSATEASKVDTVKPTEKKNNDQKEKPNIFGSSNAAAPKFNFGSAMAPVQPPAQNITAKTDVVKPVEKGFGDKFKPKVGSWSCKACYTSNTADTLYCACCEEPKDDTVPKKEKQNIFGSSDGETSKFSFGNLSATQNQAASTSTSTAGTFGSSTFSFSFGSNKTTSTEAPTFGKPAEVAAVPKLDSKEFNFVFKGKSPGKQAPLNTSEGVEDVSDDENVEEEENTAYFAPVIPLPEKVEVKTGEEDEDVLYSHRAKLFRFRNSEWRERGLGDVKILKHKQTGQLRVVMRREQVHKICLNHTLTKDIAYIVKDSKSWQFVANDFSEGVFELDNFSLRFKTDEIARDFKKAIDDALAGNPPRVYGDTNDQSDNISNATNEEKKMISDLKLPNNFFDYKTQENCKGCRGCNLDDFVFSEVKDTNIGQVDSNPLPLVPPAKIELASNDLSKDTKNTFSFASFTQDDSNKGNANNTPAKEMLFGSNTFKSPFSVAATDDEKNENASAIFGQKTNIFGGSAVTKTSSAEPVKTTPSFSFNSSTVFGSNSEEKSPFTFATATSNAQEKSTEPKTVFGSVPTFGTPSANIFGTNMNGTTDTNKTNDASSTGFSFKLPASTSVTPTVISSTDASKTGEQQKPVTSIFGQSGGMSFADLAKNTATDKSNEPFSTSNAISFASLAQNSTNGSTAFGKSSSTGGFFGLSNKDTFSNLMSPQNVTNGNSTAKDDDNENHTDDANYDPHYDPIIELPDEIQVSTGEENEEKLFSERARLYRFDAVNKEWKERGVGDFKVLFHPINNSYRLLLRREQIHKLVLNMALSADLQINPMKQSDKAFIWVGQNFAEEQEKGELESLSVRFRNADLAKKFNETVQKCIENLKARKN